MARACAHAHMDPILFEKWPACFLNTCRAQRAVAKTAAAVQDLAQGVTKPSPGRLGASVVEGVQVSQRC